MWNRPTVFLWVSVKIRGKKRFAFAYPLALPVFLMLFDMLGDCARLCRLLPISRRKGKRKRRNLPDCRTAGIVFDALRDFQYELMFRTGPFTVADIDLKSGENRVAVRCCLR